MDINELIRYAGKPEIFARTDTGFWDDPHISKKMLEVHLDSELDAASRSHNTIEASVKWLSEKILPEKDTFLDQTTVMTDEGEIDVHRIYNHFYTKATITELLDSHGFKNHAYYSDLTGSDYNQSAETIALITHK